MNPTLRLAPLLAAFALAGAWGAASPPTARAADAAAPAWEAQTEHETAEQNREIERARQRKAMAGVVNAYASRLSRDRSPMNHYLYGRALYYNGDPVGAKRQMDYALEADPGYHPARLRLAMLLLELKSYAEAERHLTAVLARRPGDPEAIEMMTKIAVEQKDWPRAVAFLSQRLDRDPADAKARALLAQVHMQRRDWDAAAREWRVLRQRDPSVPEYRYFLGVCLLRKGDLDAAAVELEAVTKDRPGQLEALDALREVYARKKDWEKVRLTLERMVPHLPEDKRQEVLASVEQLRKGPPSEAPEAAPTVSWDDVLAAATRDGDPAARERALRALYEGCALGYVKQIPGTVLRRVTPDAEPSAGCRMWTLRILGQLSPQVLPLVSLALYDEDQTVRMIASEILADMGEPAALLYLLPFTETDPLDVVEYEAVRSALSRLTGYEDLPPGKTAVASKEDVAASREAWRRWRLAPESTGPKRDAIRQLEAVNEAAPERFLYDLVLDPSFDVAGPAYLAMRKAVARAPRDPVERKVFPRFPAVSDAEVTRAGMRSIQERVRAWWEEWTAERRAYLKAKGG